MEARDYPGQGTALVCWLDAFWESKGLVTPAQFRRFCGPTVCLCRMPKRVWTTDDTFEAQAAVSHYGSGTLASPTRWTITDTRGHEIARGEFSAQRVETGHVAATGMIRVLLAEVAAPVQLVVRVGLDADTATENSWNIWVYPARFPPVSPGLDAEPVLVAHALDDEVRAALTAGRRVLLFSSPKDLQNAVPGSFMPVFWRARLFKQTGTMGILCDPAYPALADFPTEEHSDWQWADLLGRFSAADSLRVAGAPKPAYQSMDDAAHDVSGRSKTIILDRMPPDFRPIVQVIDNYDRNHKLGVIFEAKVGAGSMLVCAGPGN